MTEDLLSRLANPDRYNMLKDIGRIDEKKILEQADAQPRAQNLRPGKDVNQEQLVQQPVQAQQPVQEVNPIETASKHPEQNTLVAFAKPVEVVEEKVEEPVVVEEPVQEVQPQVLEGVKPEPVASVEPVREVTRSYIPEPPKDVQGKSMTAQDVDVQKVETFFNKLIGRDI